MDKKIKILHLEDSLTDSELLHSLVESGSIENDYFLVDEEKDFINILDTEKIDIILSDYSLPGYNGNEALKYVREKFPHMPFIFVSGAMGEDAAINAMLNGATDYVLKNKLERLVPAIKRAMNEHELEVKRNQAEAALRESERKYKDLINEVNDGYFVTNIQGIITFANISMAKIFGFSNPEELTGHFFTEFNKTSHPQEVTYTFKNIIENKKKLDGLEMEVLRIDGNSIHIEINAVPVLGDGKIAGMQGVIHDITERKRAEINLKEKNEQIEAQNEKYIQINKELIFQNEEREKRAAELIITDKELVFQTEEKEKREVANKELEAFSYSISHDLRAPLRHIGGFVDLLIKSNSSQLDETGKKYLNTISESSIEMGNLIDALLTFSRLSSADLQRTNINSNNLVNRVLKTFDEEIEGKNIVINISELPDAKGDETLINQVWVNLISNALKYSRKKEKIVIDIGSKLENDKTIFYIKDNGAGFDMKFADKLFGVFQRLHKARDFEGIGIGLANVNRIIVRHGGKCWAEGEVGNGATFFFSIPNN
jgi:PAS domain S-box-containing protein